MKKIEESRGRCDSEGKWNWYVLSLFVIEESNVIILLWEEEEKREEYMFVYEMKKEAKKFNVCRSFSDVFLTLKISRRKEESVVRRKAALYENNGERKRKELLCSPGQRPPGAEPVIYAFVNGSLWTIIPAKRPAGVLVSRFQRFYT